VKDSHLLPKKKVAFVEDNEQKKKHLKVSNTQTQRKSSHDVIKSSSNDKPAPVQVLNSPLILFF